MVTNCDWSNPSTSFNLGGYHQPHNLIAHTLPFLVRIANEGRVEGRPLYNSHSQWKGTPIPRSVKLPDTP